MSEARTPVGAIFDAAIELPPERRAAYLLRVCGGDDGLRRRVEALLRAHESSGEFMDSPAVSVREGSAGATLAEGPGDRIGRYKLLQQIGEGGCGVVYMAEQEEPVRRRVALKVIKLGMDTKSVITRFEAERQALALMEHPNIAKVFDAGATETGRPYFVMELVRGVKVTDYCDQNNLSTRERLDLFVEICQAIQHAHQKGIIHRDIKPSNILVTVNDGVPVPKVIDFGIAKATQGRLTDDTLFTAFEQFLGTPAYMSPEQAVMTSLDIDTRSDIYSLGVLLYELLSGKTPFGAEELLAAGLDELRRTIREKEPVRPSTRLSTMLEGELKRVARQRQTEPPKLIHLLRGDLDWIVMKALEKDRNRRYPTANNLAADVKRHLLNEPVLARPPSALYRVQKLIVRNRLATLAALAILFSLIACLIISTLFYFKERRVLYASYLAEARALRMGGHVGQRFESLKAVEKAGAIRKGPEVRDEAIASLARTDLRWAREKTLGVTISGRLAHFDVPFQCYDVANDNGGVAVRRVADDQQIAELSAPGFKPVDLRGFTSDSRYLKIRSRDANSGESDWVWDIKSQKVVLRALPGSLADVFSPDGRLLGKSHPDGTFSVYDLASGRELNRTYLGRGLNIAIFDPTGGLLVGSTDEKHEVKIYDLSTGSNTFTFACPGEVTCLAWSFDGNHVAAACSDNHIYIWDAHDGKLSATLPGHASRVTELAFNHASDLLASASWDGNTRMWDPASGQCVAEFPDGGVHGLEFTADDHYLGIFQNSVHAGLLEVAHRGENRRLPLNSQRFSGPSFSANGRIIAAGTDDGVCLWDADSGRKLGVIRGEGGWTQLFHPDGRRLFVCTEKVGLSVCPLDKMEGADRVSYHVGPPETLVGGDALHEADLSLDGRHLVVADFADSECIVLDLENPTAKVVLRGHPMVDYVAISPDGHWAASGSWNNARVKIWDARSGELIKTLNMPGRTRVTFSPDGRWLATSTQEYQLWETGSWQPKGPPIQGYAVPEANSLVFNSDGRLMAITHDRNKVQLLETMTGKVVATLESPDSFILSRLHFSPDNTRLAAARIDGQIEVWDLRMIRQELAEMQLDWDQPPYPPAPNGEKLKPVSVRIDPRTPNQSVTK